MRVCTAGETVAEVELPQEATRWLHSLNDDDGSFDIQGTYPYDAYTYTFRYSYIYEGVDWKVVGVRGNLK